MINKLYVFGDWLKTEGLCLFQYITFYKSDLRQKSCTVIIGLEGKLPLRG